MNHEKRLELILHILHIESQIDRSSDQREIDDLKHQRWNLHVQLAKMQETTSQHNH